MRDDTDRRKRAEKWLLESPLHSTEIDPADAYLAGAREEAALAAEEAKRVELCTTRLVSEYGRRLDEKDAEIAALKQNDANREALLDSLLRLRTA